MTVLDVLQAARKLIAKRSHWCKDMSAADCEGAPALYWSETACRWCAWAAILRVGGPSVNDKAIALLERHTDGMSLIRFNDKSDHADILRLFDRAIGEASGLRLLS